jgi:hypothetical protein
MFPSRSSATLFRPLPLTGISHLGNLGAKYWEHDPRFPTNAKKTGQSLAQGWPNFIIDGAIPLGIPTPNA